MKMLVFYRSREYTNAIISSTRAKLQSNKNVVGLEVDFVNLDKRNYKKVLDQIEDLPRFIYIWYDEEKVTDYIHETYPSIEVISFNVENSVNKQYDSWRGYSKKDYKLDELMIEKFKENLEKREVFIVDKYDNYKISKENFDDLDCANKRQSGRYEIFKTKDIAQQFCCDSINNDIQRIEEDIIIADKHLKDKKKELSQKRNLLKKYIPKTE